MSVNKYYRQTWIALRYGEVVRLFHEQRKLEDQAHRELESLARACAVTVFAENADSIIGDRDKTAKEFMAYVSEHIADEIQDAILESEIVELVC